MCKYISQFFDTIRNIYLVEKNWALLIDLLKVKNNILHYPVHSEENGS